MFGGGFGGGGGVMGVGGGGLKEKHAEDWVHFNGFPGAEILMVVAVLDVVRMAM